MIAEVDTVADHDKKYARAGSAPGVASSGSNGRTEPDSGSRSGRDAASGRSVSWEAYRGWLSKMDRSTGRRRGARSIYTWKGYKAWAAKIRANWDVDNVDS